MTRWIWLLLIPPAVLLALWGLRSWPQKQPPTLTPTQNAPSHKIHVEILNGCGITGIARHVGRHLRDRGFDVLTLGNAESFHFPESIVIDRVGKPEYARQVAEALGVPNRIQQLVPDPFRIEEVTVIVGRDYSRLNIPPLPP